MEGHGEGKLLNSRQQGSIEKGRARERVKGLDRLSKVTTFPIIHYFQLDPTSGFYYLPIMPLNYGFIGLGI